MSPKTALGVIAFVAVGGFVMVAGNEATYVRTFVPEKKEATLVFGGDMMFDRSIREWGVDRGEDYLFSCVRDVLDKADLVVANLEGPITTRKSVSVGSSPGGPNNTRFTFPTTTATLLAQNGIDIVSIANNHAQDFGREGIESTISFLDAAGVAYFGDPLEERVFTTLVNGVPLAFIGYNEFQRLVGDLWQGSMKTVEHIRAAKADGYLPIVFSHWGSEYVGANAQQKRLARSFVEAGAELVVGAHPHVVQEHEEYLGKHIYYSIGNFVFDQYFSEDVRNGLILRASFTKRGVENLEEIPAYLERDRRVCIR